MTKILQLILMTGMMLAAILLGWQAFEANDRADRYLQANGHLSDLIGNGDAMVEAQVDHRTGDIFVRVNGNNDNVHPLWGICQPSLNRPVMVSF